MPTLHCSFRSSDGLQLYTPSRTLRSASDTLSFQIPRARLSTVGFPAFFLVFGSSTWNDPPHPPPATPFLSRQKPSLNSFRSNLETFVVVFQNNRPAVLNFLLRSAIFLRFKFLLVICLGLL